MKRRLLALLLGVMLLAQLAMPAAGAAKDVCFVGAGEYILALNDDTMPFWQNGYLYISTSVFTGTGRESLSVSSVYNQATDSVILYRDEDALVFEMKKDHAWDTEYNIYYPGAVRKGGNIYVPAAIVAKMFGLQYSYLTVPHGNLVWLRRPDLQLPDRIFVDAASQAMEERYAEYRNAMGITSGQENPAGSAAAITGKVVYLCVQAGETTSALLDALGRYGAQAAFFCTPAYMETQGDLLRRMTVTGQSIGILVDGEDETAGVTEQAERANRALERATCGRTRLVKLENGSEADKETLRAAGYRCLEEDLDRSGYALRTSAQAESLHQRIASRRGNCAVWLGENVSVAGVQAFLRSAAEEEGRCLAWTETA